ncbi:MAG: HD domain-containing protein [Candidatus Adiutrix sp.]|jgi:tRNA nucleotidyltransferase (CCA-adding enzyme)|nr:HD domain-containing protein [Candidatus Adiutrix sp.]
MTFDFLRPLAEAMAKKNGRLLLAGGVVRDHFLKLFRGMSQADEEKTDCDLAASGLGLEKILEIAAGFGPAKIVRRRTCLDQARESALIQLKLNGKLLELSLVRGLPTGGDGLPDDALARDYTINAVYLDPLTDEALDPLGGLSDLKRGRLRLCRDQALADDPLRMLRGMGLISRFDLSPAPQLLAAVKRDLNGLIRVPPDRFWPEWRKWAASARPHLGLDFLEASGLLRFWPQLYVLKQTPQDPYFHPEGDVWRHTALAVKVMSELPLETADRRIKLVLAALLHDLGKPAVTTRHEGRWVSRRHAQAGLPPAEEFLRSIKAPGQLIPPVLKLVGLHMDLKPQDVAPKALRRLARRLAPECDLADYWALSVADWNGRGPGLEPFPLSLTEFLAPAGNLARPRPPFLRGRDLMARFNLAPGPAMGRILRRLDEAADDGLVKDEPEALALAARMIKEEAGRRP